MGVYPHCFVLFFNIRYSNNIDQIKQTNWRRCKRIQLCCVYILFVSKLFLVLNFDFGIIYLQLYV